MCLCIAGVFESRPLVAPPVSPLPVCPVCAQNLRADTQVRPYMKINYLYDRGLVLRDGDLVQAGSLSPDSSIMAERSGFRLKLRRRKGL
jgi:hypothetical protein